MKLNGIFTALTTPFDSDGNLSRGKVNENVRGLNRTALSGYAVCGSTGETPLLSVDERFALMDCVREASAPGKILIAGLASDSVHESVQIANHAAESGYQVVLALTPFYYRTQMQRPETQLTYYRAVADQSKLPVLLYNMPGVSGYDLPAEIIAELSTHENIIGIKDSSGNLEKLREVVKSVPPYFQILSGAGSNFGEALHLGAVGAILAIANVIPDACVAIWETFRTQQGDACREWQERIGPFSKVIAGKHGIPGLKHAMDLAGYYGGPPRLPFVPPSAEGQREIAETLNQLLSSAENRRALTSAT